MRKCKNCKSINLDYKEDFIIRYTAWWQWLAGWIGSIVATIFMPIIGIPAIIALIVSMFRRKKKVYTYTCRDCGYVKEI